MLSDGFLISGGEFDGGWLQNKNHVFLAYHQYGPDSADPSSPPYMTALVVATALSISVEASVVSSVFEDACHLLTVGPVNHPISGVYLGLAWEDFPLSRQAQPSVEPGLHSLWVSHGVSAEVFSQVAVRHQTYTGF